MSEQTIGIGLLAIGAVIVFAALRGDRARFVLARQPSPSSPLPGTDTTVPELDDPDEPEPDGMNLPPIQGLARQANGAVRMQSGLPPATQAAWRFAALTWPGIVQITSWGDKAHEQRRSCHNTGQALDLRIAKGAKATPAETALGQQIADYFVANAAKHDARVVIFNSRIASARRGWTWRPYGGPGRSPHTNHVHVSIGCDG